LHHFAGSLLIFVMSADQSPNFCLRDAVDALRQRSSADQALGDYDDEPIVIFKAGRLPDLFEN
jgi:hypothetical protein